MKTSFVIFKKSKSRCFISKCYQLPDGVVFNKFSDVILKNFSIKSNIPVDGFYMMTCRIEPQQTGKPIVTVTMNKEVLDIDNQIKILDEQYGL